MPTRTLFLIPVLLAVCVAAVARSLSAQGRPTELPAQQQSTIAGNMTGDDVEPALSFMASVATEPSTPILVTALLAGARAQIKSKVAAGEVKWVCVAPKPKERGEIGAWTFADRYDAMTGRLQFTRAGHDTVVVNKRYKGESAYLASTLFHELVHCYQDEPNSAEPKEKAWMEVEAYCREIAFCEWAWGARAMLTVAQQRAVFDLLDSARKNKDKEKEKTC